MDLGHKETLLMAGLSLGHQILKCTTPAIKQYRTVVYNARFKGMDES